LNIDFRSNEQLICFDGEEVFFESDIQSSNSNVSLSWSFESGSPSTSSSPEQSVIYPTPGIYDVDFYVSNENCSDSILREGYIEVYEEADLQLDNFEICEGDTLALIANGNTDYYNWIPEDIFLSVEDSLITFIPTVNTELSVFGAIGPCPEISSVSTITVYENPSSEMENFHVYFPGQELIIGPDEVIDSLNYIWDASDVLSCSFCPNPSILLDSVGDFRLQITDPFTGCTFEEVVQVRKYSQCPDISLGIPNAFSPNGDGVNDEFKVAASLLEGIEFIRVFDRWGNYLWGSEDISQGWDGNFKGQKMKAGVYVYALQARCPIDGRPFQKHGDITLLR